VAAAVVQVIPERHLAVVVVLVGLELEPLLL
jgi:hypothetical protein